MDSSTRTGELGPWRKVPPGLERVAKGKVDSWARPPGLQEVTDSPWSHFRVAHFSKESEAPAESSEDGGGPHVYVRQAGEIS